MGTSDYPFAVNQNKSQRTYNPRNSRTAPRVGTSAPTSGLPSHGPTLESLVPSKTFTPGISSMQPYQNYESAVQNNLSRASALGLGGAQQQPWGTSGGGGGGGRRGGGGGGGGGVNPADFDVYAEAMRQAIASRQGPAVGGVNRMEGMANPLAGMKSPLVGMINPLTAMINPAVDKEMAEARAAFAAIPKGVSMADPYAQHRNTAAPTVDPGLAEYARTQQMGDDYGAQVGLAQQNAASGAANWQSLAGVLGQNHVAGQQGILDVAQQQGALVNADLSAQRLGLNAGAQVQQTKMDREAANQQLSMDRESAMFGSSLDQMTRQSQMGLDAERRGREDRNNDVVMQMIMDLINAGVPYGKAPNLKGLL